MQPDILVLHLAVGLCQSDLSQGDELCGADLGEKLWVKVSFNSWLMISGRCTQRDYLQCLPINSRLKKSESLSKVYFDKSSTLLHRWLPGCELPRLSATHSQFWSSNWFLQTSLLKVLLGELLHPRTRVVCYGVQAEPGTMDAKMLSSILYFILYFCSLACMYGAHADPGAMGANATSHLRCFH